jgi:hypothetical protein
MKRQILIGLATLGALAIFSPAALACTCDYLPTNKAAFRKASAVFVGEVVSKSAPKRPANWNDDDTAAFVSHIVTFKVEKRWKAARHSEVDAWLDVSYSHCSVMQFREGEKYLIYADSYKGSLIIYWCDKAALTAPLSSKEAEERVQQLGQR